MAITPGGGRVAAAGAAFVVAPATVVALPTPASWRPPPARLGSRPLPSTVPTGTATTACPALVSRWSRRATPRGCVRACPPGARWRRGHAARRLADGGGDGGGRGGGRAGRGACVRVRGWVVRVDLPVRCVRGHRAEQNASWERMAALAGLCQRRRPPHMTPQPPGTSNRWNTHILGWNTGRVRPGLVRPRRPLRREPPDLALSAPFRGRVAASPGLHVAATPTARCTASGVRPARRGGACRPRLSGPAEHVSGASSKSRQILPSRRRSTAAMRPRPGCALPRHPPRGALHPGVGQLVGGGACRPRLSGPAEHVSGATGRAVAAGARAGDARRLPARELEEWPKFTWATRTAGVCTGRAHTRSAADGNCPVALQGRLERALRPNRPGHANRVAQTPPRAR